MRPLTPPQIAAPFGRYAHGVELAPGQRMVRTSGQLALRADGTVPPDAAGQAGLIFENIGHILAEADMGPGDVFHLTAYVTRREDMPAYMAARDRFLAGLADLPSSSLLIVSGFTRPEFLVEIEVWAAAP